MISLIVLLGLVLYLLVGGRQTKSDCMCTEGFECPCASWSDYKSVQPPLAKKRGAISEGFTAAAAAATAAPTKKTEGPYPPLKVLVINLDARHDRWKRVSSMLDEFGVDYERFPAIKASPGWLGCGLSHSAAAEEAKRRRYMWVLVLEDDCVITKENWRRFEELLPWLWKNRGEWNLFNGGLTYANNVEVLDKKKALLRSNGFAMHFILYQPAVYDTIRRWNRAEPVDVYVDKKIKAIAPYPLIATQEKGESDIVGSHTEYDDLIDKTNGTFRVVLGL